MPDRVWLYVDSILTAAGSLSREQWITISVLVLVIGLICMRGFGSRTNY